ncbi:Protein PAIR1 [Vitis vinifera]|uniref:Protein PAIR1 n=1 Tax=Vitis vinifera TaxID=29760 RepID=A0A438EH38_VITVI|nr:Protein PAIR1 [Vitis vinifera]
MKMKINKACDLSSISVLPPHTRRSSTVPTGPQVSQQLRSQQQSQQSFSQSQHGMFSQFSQNSLDEIVANDQRFGSQERENSMKRISCLAPVSFTREESQIPISRSSTSLARKWSSASAPDYRCQIGEDLEHRIGMMETSLTRFGMILDSIQSDVMQVNKGMKEFLMEMEGLRQKLTVHDSSLLLMNKGHEDIKDRLDAALKSISDQMNKDLYQDNLQQSFLMLSALPEQIEMCLQKLQNELCKTITKEMQASLKFTYLCIIQLFAGNRTQPEDPQPKICNTDFFSTKCTLLFSDNDLLLTSFHANKYSDICSHKTSTLHNCRVPVTVPLQRKSHSLSRSMYNSYSFTKKILHDPRPVLPTKVCMQATLPPKIEMGSWNSVQRERATFPDRNSNRQPKQNGVSPLERERECRVIIDSDEEIDGGFSCLLQEKESGK